MGTILSCSSDGIPSEVQVPRPAACLALPSQHFYTMLQNMAVGFMFFPCT